MFGWNIQLLGAVWFFQTTFIRFSDGICRGRNHQMLHKPLGIGCVVLYTAVGGRLSGL